MLGLAPFPTVPDTSTAAVPRQFSVPLLRSLASRYPYLFLLDNCSSTRQLRSIHAHFLVLGLVRFSYITSRLLAFLASPRSNPSAVSDTSILSYARSIFDRTRSPSPFDWNAMIRCSFANSRRPEEDCFSLYAEMRRRGVSPNMFTFPTIIKVTNRLRSLSQAHGQVSRFGFGTDVFVVSTLVSKYADCGMLELAFRVFDESTHRNVVCWTSMLTGCCERGMTDRGRQVFDEMPERNQSSWSAMISGYVRNEQFKEAVDLFREMRASASSSLEPNSSLLVSILSACSRLGEVEEGKWVRAYLDSKGCKYDLETATALVDFYSKTGSLQAARKLFDRMPVRDVTAWSAMINGLAVNGHCLDAIRVYSEMLGSGVMPNSITFIGLLSACSHGGLVDEAWEHFNSMSGVYGIAPTCEHYGCMVDVLARAGMIAEAEQLIKQMPMKPDAAVWGALLNGCILHKEDEVGKRIGRILVELEPEHAGRYIGLSNMYASGESWRAVARTRRMMKEKGVIAGVGWSSVELEDGSVSQLSGQRSEPSRDDKNLRNSDGPGWGP